MGYLDEYGAGDEMRERRVKHLILAGLGLLLLVFVAFLVFHNRAEKALVEQFGALLVKKDHKAAYQLWGCSDDKPCREYPFQRFMEDWGPGSPHGEITSYRVVRAGACGSGVIVTLEVGGKRWEKLWVERSDNTIGFSPWPRCPKREFSERVLDKFKDWMGIGVAPPAP